MMMLIAGLSLLVGAIVVPRIHEGVMVQKASEEAK